MMKIAAISALVACASAASVQLSVERVVEEQPTFAAFKSMFGKTYADDAEHARVEAIFADNVDFINAHNAKWAKGESTFNMGVNAHCDLSHDEFKARFIGPKIAERKVTNLWNAPTQAKFMGAADAVDWRAKGAVTPVKNQGQCGSCWSFSTTGSTEGRVQISTGKLVSLSEQQLMDCSTKEGDQSCQGGLMDYGFQYIIDNKGINTEAAYPYKEKNEKCDASLAKVAAATITGFKDVKPKSEADLATAVAAGPVSVAIEADQRSFQTYKSGTLTAACGTKLDHGVLAVGYGDGYWIVKNSWGPSWGMDGYIQLGRGTATAAGECGIAAQPSFPEAGSAPPTPPGPAPPAPPSPGPSPPPGKKTKYEDPNNGPCSSGEEAVQITGVQGSFCSPKCEKEKKCSKDVPKGTTAEPQCVLETSGSSKPTQCALICTPSADGKDGCPENASCKAISGTGLCTYDE